MDCSDGVCRHLLKVLCHQGEFEHGEEYLGRSACSERGTGGMVWLLEPPDWYPPAELPSEKCCYFEQCKTGNPEGRRAAALAGPP